MRILIGNSTDIDLVGPFERDGASWWAQRLVWFARDGDVVVLPGRPEDAYLDYVTGLTGTDLGSLRILVPPAGFDGTARLTRDRLLHPDFVAALRDAVGGRPVESIRPLWPDASVVALADALGYAGAVPGGGFLRGGGGALVNSKAVFRSIADGIGVPVPEGAVCVSRDTARAAIDGLLERGVPVMVKHEFYSGGVGNDILSPYEGVRPIGAPRTVLLAGADAVPAYLDENWDRLTSGGAYRLVVERYHPDSRAIFAEFDITDAGPQPGGNGEIVSKPIANAQAIPAYGPMRAHLPAVTGHGRRLCEPLHAMGYRGRLSADAIVTPEGEVLFTEYNGRVTGSTHLYDVIGQRVVGPDYAEDRILFERVGWRAPSFQAAVEAVRAAGLAYRPEDRQGVVFCSAFDTTVGSVWYCIVAPDIETVQATEAALARLFPQPGSAPARPAVPAILGGEPAFADEVPLSRPSIAVDDDLTGTMRAILDSGAITKGPQMSALEGELAEFLGVEHAVLVSSCTVGLVLTLRCLDLRGEVVMPSFTFMASGHAARWNGLTPVFADINPATCTLSTEDSAAAMTGATAAVLAVHTFGTPCDADGLGKLAAGRGVPLVIDAAPAFGGRYGDGAMVGSKGLAEVFSLSPTKPLTTGEGGIVATADAGLARALRTAREYGNPGSYDSAMVGLNGRLPELAAALGRRNLPHIPEWLAQRGARADRFRAGLADVPGIAFTEVPIGAVSTHKDLTITVDPERFGLDRDGLTAALRAERIATRNYFDPPLHRQTAYRDVAARPLPYTDALAARVIALPLYPHMAESAIDRICAAIHGIHAHAGQIAARLTDGRS